MRFQSVKGPPRVVQCSGCSEERTAGSLPYRAASGRQLDTVYQDETGSFYCEGCATRHVEAIDPTRSVTRFYADTRGERILDAD